MRNLTLGREAETAAYRGALPNGRGVEGLPEDEWRTELVAGRIVREPPAGFAHGGLATRLASRLDSHVRERGLGMVLGAETGFVLSEEPGTVRAPDVAFVSRARLPTPEARAGFARLAPDLAVETVSPSNTVAEVQAKVLDYLEAGSRMVWVVDPRTRSVTLYESLHAIRLLREPEEIEGADLLPGLRLPVAELFAD